MRWMRFAIIVLIYCTQSFAVENEQNTKASPPSEKEISVRFKTLVNKYKLFFSTPKICYNKQKFSKSPTGFIYNVGKFVSDGDLSYDVKRTDSLISPYTGYILMTVKQFNTKKYGDIISFGEIIGFSTIDSLKVIAKNDNYFTISEVVPFEEIQFNFAFQDGKWIWKSAIRTKYNNPAIYISTALGDGVGIAIPLPENKAWLKLIRE